MLSKNCKPMIQHAGLPPVNGIEKISASQFYAATLCPFKLVLANAFKFQQLLPVSPNAYLGSVLHKMIELISKRIIKDNLEFETEWRSLIAAKETELQSTGSGAMTPLKHFCDDFALKKLKVKCLLNKQVAPFKSSASVMKSRSAEERVTNPENTVVGIVDLIIQNGDYVSLLDFKTGAIYKESLDEYGELSVKKDYEYQLKLYAYLYYQKTGVIPKRLFVVTLDNAYIEIRFTMAECQAIYANVVKFLGEINEKIKKGNFLALANCNLDNCKFCGYRPACKYYDTWMDANSADTKDLKGKLLKINVFGNNTVGLEMEVTGKKALINGFNPDLKEDLEMNIGQEVKIYNLKKSKTSLNAFANHYTKIYA